MLSAAPKRQERHREEEPTAPSTAVLSVEHASIAIDSRAVVRDVSFSVEPGEFVALMGANGSGKSTLVRGITGILPVVDGSVRLFGTDVARLRDRSRIGYVPQRGAAGSGVPASVAEVVAAGRVARRRPLAPARSADRAAVAQALETVGLTAHAQTRVTALSGGQQQRVLIARALAAEPEILFLDEPMAGIDLPHQLALADTLAALSATGVTLVMVLHELGPVAELVDRCLVMRSGRLEYDGAPLTEVEAHQLASRAPHSEALEHDRAPHLGGALEERHQHHCEPGA